VKLLQRFHALLCGAAVLVSAPAGAQSLPFDDSRVQAPELSAPQRGSLVGQYAHTAFGPADVARGGFRLPSPFAVPADRGPLLATPFPSYSPEGGLTEWGMGWSTQLSLHRWRAAGDLDFTTDDLNGPWGRLVQGADGAWFPPGLSPAVRVVSSGGALVALLPDGSRWTFGAARRVDTPLGTYAWYLEEVRDATGRRTRLTWTANDSGRPFLERVDFGGRGEDFQYQVALAYEPITRPFLDYRSGLPLMLDRRVGTVTVRARNTASGAWEERWHYLLGHEDDALGPAFRLAEVQQVFASGERPPAHRYTYNSAREALDAAAFLPTSALDGPMAVLGTDFFLPRRAAPLDADLDGRLDLEHHQRQTLLVQEGGQFRLEELPAPTPDTVERCRPAESYWNEPRKLARLKADSEDLHVVSLEPASGYMETALTVCDRQGRVLGEQLLPGDFTPGPNSRLVDVDRDRQPDLLAVYAGGYTVLPNISAGNALGFGAQHSGGLMPYFTPHTTWVQEMNGDGVADLVARFDSGLVVWYGRGRFDFDPTGQVLPLRLSYGAELTDLLNYQVSFADVTKDGLTDVLLTRPGITLLFVNTGSELAEVNFPAQAILGSSTFSVTVANLTGVGGTQLTAIHEADVYVATLDAPGTGLLRAADDGMGTVLRLEYAWSPPVPGARQQQAVLSGLEVESSGNEPVQYAYGYAQPVLHPEGRFLLGYGEVTRTAPASVLRSTFFHGERQAGLLLEAVTRDPLTPGLRRYEQRAYESVLYQGQPWKRLREVRQGWASDTGGGALEERTEYTAYAADICPTRTVQTTAHGTLVTERHRATVPGLDGHPHCLEERIVLTGQHADASLDFRHEARLRRNAVGLVEHVESVGDGATLPLQDVVYRADSTVERISVPGRGTTHFDFEPGGVLLRAVTAPDGTRVEVRSRDARTDDLLTLLSHAGTKSFTQSFRYDGQERLERQWDSLGVASEASPALRLAYEQATATQPAAFHVTTRVDAGAARRTTEWVTAGGEPVATGQRIPEGWAFHGLTSRHDTLRETRRYTRPTAPGTTAPGDLTYEDLLAGAQQVGRARTAGFGHDVEALERLHADVEKRVTTGLTLVPGFLQRESVENDTYRTTLLLDASERVRTYEDPARTRYHYTYDALGRLRAVRLPDGRAHRLSFDGHGRVSRVQREGLASVEYTYDAATGLPTGKRFLSPAAVPQRSEAWTYDGIGRKVEVLHEDEVTGATQAYRFYFDGATPDAPAQRTHLGVLSAVQGPGYLKTFHHRADGKLERRVLRLDGWRTVDTQLTYTDGGEVREEATRLYAADGTLLTTSVRVQSWDAYGRLAAVQLNGLPLAAFTYDGNGQAARATFATGETVTLGYDPLTRRRVSIAQAGPAWSSSTGVRLNARGFIGTESFVVGGQALLRQYGYSAQGFLSGAADAQRAYAYGFDGDGLPRTIEEEGVQRELVQQGNTLVAGALTYTFDALGRTLTRNDLTLHYGPHGHVARATRGAREWHFLYDEDGQRLLKRDGSTPVAAYLDGGAFLDAGGLAEPFRFGGQLVGLVRGGVFQMVATDIRGTVMADSDGTARLASPFGHRDVHPDLAAAVDYVQKGYDADLGVVRMGVRDYDPSIQRFLTPDPLFLESPERCVTSPVECNLYGYAGGNPAAYVDPSGEALESLWDAASLAMGVASIASWDEKTSTLDKVMDVAGVVADAAALAVPFVPGGAGAAIKAYRVGDKVVDTVKAADKARDTAGFVSKADEGAAAAKASKECLTGGCKVPGIGCFVAGTPVLTKEGLKPIEQVEVGDSVWSRDDTTGFSGWRRVLHTKVSPDKPVVDLELRADDGRVETVGATPDHPFWVEGEGWVQAGSLQPGMRVPSAHGGWLRVSRATWRQSPETVFNFEVEEYHTYFVGGLAAWVHNNKGCVHEASDATERAKEIHGALKEVTQRKTTVAVTETQEGIRVISSSEDRLRPAQRKLLKEGEVEARGKGHAEVTGVNAARAMGLTPTGTAASRPVCQNCAKFLEKEGVPALSPLKGP
jgi:RHS repeat-associated protein